MLVASIEDLGIRHDGQKGMKWGVRRYQNYDGTLTDAGKARYRKGTARLEKLAGKYETLKNAQHKQEQKLVRANRRVSKYDKRADKYAARADKWSEKAERTRNEDRAQRYSVRSAQYSAKLDKAEAKLHKWEQISRNIETKALNYKVKSLKVKKQHDKTLTSLMKVPAIKKRLIKDIERDDFDGRSRFIRHADTDQGLQHYGTLGMKWGIRRYQNKDGTLTPAGKRRYGTVENLRADFDRKAANKARKIRSRVANAPASASDVEKYGRELKNARLEKKAAKLEEDYKQWMEKRELKAKTLRDVAEEKRKANEAAKAKKEADEAAAAKAERDAYEKAKLDAINSGNPAAIVQYVSGMTTDEINAASDRVGAMRRLDAMIRETDRSALADADGPGSRSTPIANMSVKGMLKEYAKKSIREMLFGDDTDGKKEDASSGNQAAEEPRKAPAQYGESYMGTMRQTAEAVASAARKKAAENGGSLKDQVEAAAKAYADTMNYAADARANMFEGRAPKKPADDASGPDVGGDHSNEQTQSSATSSSGSASGLSRKSRTVSFKGSVPNLSKRVADLNDRISGYSDKSVDDIIGQKPTSDMSDANERLFKNHTAINDLLKKKGLK